MNPVDRIYAALNHRPVDKVPKGELGIADELVTALTGVQPVDSAAVVAASKRLGMDLVNRWCAGTPEEVLRTEPSGNTVTVDRWGSVRRRSAYTDEIIEVAAREPEDGPALEFPPLSAYDEGVATIRALRENSGLFVLAQTEGVLTPMTWLYGFEDFMVYTCTDPDEVARFAHLLAEHYAALATRLIDAGAHAILIGDDIAYNTGTYIAPQVMREVIFPALRHEVALIKRHSDVPVLMHTDGDLRAVMDDIVDCGFDGLQSLQPTANMDLKAIKRDYGEKLCLMGNIDINEVLPSGDEETVRRVVRETIDIGLPGSGYILSTCNILTRDIPLQNAVAMYDEAERYPVPGAVTA